MSSDLNNNSYGIFCNSVLRNFDVGCRLEAAVRGEEGGRRVGRTLSPTRERERARARWLPGKPHRAQARSYNISVDLRQCVVASVGSPRELFRHSRPGARGINPLPQFGQLANRDSTQERRAQKSSVGTRCSTLKTQSSLMLMFRNCTRLEAGEYLPSLKVPWCWSANAPFSGMPGSCAFSITVLPLASGTFSRPVSASKP